MKELCPICEEGRLTEYFDQNDLGGLYYSICDHCLSILASADQIRRNREIAVNNRRVIKDE